MAKLYQRAIAFLSPEARPLLLDSLRQYRSKVKAIHETYVTTIDGSSDIYALAESSDDMPPTKPRASELDWQIRIIRNLERVDRQKATREFKARDNKIIHDFFHRPPRS